ncbi:MAG: hypothetical protein L0Y35_03490 [Flammeovirgaceae bacterium]|nr:hypothetical protein [Flammeovirgaceae bacterium]
MKTFQSYEYDHKTGRIVSAYHSYHTNVKFFFQRRATPAIIGFVIFGAIVLYLYLSQGQQ